MIAGVVVTGIGVVLLVAWWFVWNGPLEFWTHRPRTVRFLVHPWPGWGLFWIGSGLVNIGESLGGDFAVEHPVEVLGGLLLLLGAAPLVLLGLLAALVGLFRGLPGRLDPFWLREHELGPDPITPAPRPAPVAPVAAPPGTGAGTPPGTGAGTPSGTGVGTPSGTGVGTPSGTSMGTPSGTSMGTPPGTSMGTPPGTSMGTPPGTSVGTPPGTSVGASAGGSDSAPVIPAAANPAVRRRARRQALWERTQPARLGVLVVAMTVAAVFLAFGDDPKARVAGILWLVFIGGGALILAGLAAAEARSSVPPRVGPVPGEPQRRGLVFATDRVGQLITATAAAVFALVAAGLAGVALFGPSDGGSSPLGVFTLPGLVAGVAGVAFFGPASLAALAGALREGGLAMTPDGIVYRSGGSGFDVAYEEIDSAGVRSFGSSWVVTVRARHPGGLESWGHLRMLAPMQRRLLDVDVAISTRTIRADSDLLQASLAHVLDHPDDRARLVEPSPDGAAASAPMPWA